MKIKLNETPQKCSHILLDIGGERIVTTKQDLMGAKIFKFGDLEENIYLNQVRKVIIKSGLTNWIAIKNLIKLQEFEI